MTDKVLNVSGGIALPCLIILALLCLIGFVVFTEIEHEERVNLCEDDNLEYVYAGNGRYGCMGKDKTLREIVRLKNGKYVLTK